MNFKRRCFFTCVNGVVASLALISGAALAASSVNQAHVAVLAAKTGAAHIRLAQARDSVEHDISTEDSPLIEDTGSQPASMAAPAAASRKPEAAAVPLPPSDSADDTASRKAPEDSSESRTSPQRFVPSEQLRADFDVSFPIDI